jgi:heat shock protein HslJ
VALAAGVIAAAVLLAACGGAASRLAGTSWQLATLDGHPALTDGTAWIRFDKGGRFSGSPGCNSLGGTWKSSGSNISFSEISTTLIGCPDAVAEQEAAFNAALEATTSYAIEGATLTLKDGRGVPRMTFDLLMPTPPSAAR